LEKQTPWQPDIAEPPLTVGRAVSLAKTWVISKGSDTNAYVETITIKPIDSSGSKNKFYSIWFYKIQFGGVGIYGHHMTCIVLMDGTIAEMEHLGVPSRKRSYLDYLD